MNAIEIRNLSKSFRGMYAVDHLNMTVPVGAIYGFIGENGSGKSTTEKLICGHLVPDKGIIKLFGRNFTDPGVRVRVGALIENPGCFPGSSVYQNLMMQAINLGLENRDAEIRRVLDIVRMGDSAGIKYKSCSLGMKQRIGIAMALLGDPMLLVLDEPLNGLDADGMRIMREVLTDVIRDGRRSVIVSSHLLGELQKVATHYGIIRHGKMIREMTAAELDADCRTYAALRCGDMRRAKALLGCRYSRVEEDEAGNLRVYDRTAPEEIVTFLYENGICVTEIRTDKIGLEEYYIDLMKGDHENG
ncbi:MAG: ATP-binding cassette domain-containing protein [Eubacteriales bacterium]|nr:ATP-binding cassette domain-containing protein [Eubacteriales bacterium]